MECIRNALNQIPVLQSCDNRIDFLFTHMNVNLEHLRSGYALAGLDSDFDLGLRQELRYAAWESYSALMQINPNGPDPLEYVSFAKADCQEKTARGGINAIGNAKRAIHLTVDCCLELLGLSEAYQHSKFPDKLEILNELEICPSNLLGRLNHRRNEVEHEFQNVDWREVLDYVDVAELFVRLCFPFFKRMIVGVHVGFKANVSDIMWMINLEESTLEIYELENAEFSDTIIGRIYFNWGGRNERLIDRINLQKKNSNLWLPPLNTMIYCSKKALLNNTPPYDPKEAARIMVFKESRWISVPDQKITDTNIER